MTRKELVVTGSVGLALFLAIGVTQAPTAFGQAAADNGAPKGPVQRPVDPRVQQRKYHFADTNEDLPYAVYVSSKVSKDKKNPLIVALHGLGGDHNSLMRGNAIDLAEAGGYILVGPMGYNPRGWYGSPLLTPRPGTAKKGPVYNDPANLRELSEKDVMNVLELIRKEFNVDAQRTYLMGHSMGGAGTLYLGSKHASNWAAIAAIAPAAFAMQANAAAMFTPVKDTLPLIITQGDADTAVPVANTRAWNDALKGLVKNFQYVEMAGEDHGTIIAKGMPDIYAFFAAHSKASH